MAKTAVMQALLRIAMQVLAGVLAEIVNQTKILESILDTIQGFFPLIATWQGEDADAFRDKVSNRLLPEIAALLQALLGINKGIESAKTVVEQADVKCAGYADDLAQTFRAIY